MVHRILLAGLLCLASVTDGRAAPAARPQPAASRTEVAFHGFVNWDFRHRRKLKGWKATAIAIQKTLGAWYPQRITQTLVENGTPGDLRTFLHSLPNRSGCDLSIVYLASHQSPATEWDFVQKKTESLDAIVGESNIPGHPARIVIVDACYAAALRLRPAWNRAVQSPTLFASLADEETQELDFRSPHPVDLPRRYPMASQWLNAHMGKEWNGRLSFLGFVWVQTFVTSKSAPQDQKSWVEFLRRCGQTAEEFRRDADKRLASGVNCWSPTGVRPPVREPRKR